KPQPTQNFVLPTWMRPWEQFWFTPADPTVLALMRICSGLIIVYTFFAYCFTLQDFMGEHAWVDLALRRETINERPVHFGPLQWNEAGPLPEAVTEFQKDYKRDYRRKWGVFPPPPYPNDYDYDMVKWLDAFRAEFGVDARLNGLRLPEKGNPY